MSLINPCLICQIDPSSHSFMKITSENPTIKLFYSCPAKAARYFDMDAKGIVEHFRLNLDMELLLSNKINSNQDPVSNKINSNQDPVSNKINSNQDPVSNKINSNQMDWAYVLDLQGYTLRHSIQLPQSIALVELVKERYADSLKKVWIINYSWPFKIVMNTLLAILPENIKKIIELSDKTVEQIQNMSFIL